MVFLKRLFHPIRTLLCLRLCAPFVSFGTFHTFQCINLFNHPPLPSPANTHVHPNTYRGRSWRSRSWNWPQTATAWCRGTRGAPSMLRGVASGVASSTTATGGGAGGGASASSDTSSRSTAASHGSSSTSASGARRASRRHSAKAASAASSSRGPSCGKTSPTTAPKNASRRTHPDELVLRRTRSQTNAYSDELDSDKHVLLRL